MKRRCTMMAQDGKRRDRRWLAALALVGLLAGAAWGAKPSAGGATKGSAEENADARRILAESGFHGGLVVLAGRWDAELAISLGKAPNVLVHGLVADGERLEGLRGAIRKAGVYGRVSAVAWPGGALPYADGMVNLLVVADEEGKVAAGETDRVLAPLGSVCVRKAGKWRSRRKAWPADVDEWTHVRYDATGNAVSKDKRVGPPRFLQWEATPRWNRGVKTSCLVTAKGRLFFILDDSHFAAQTRTWSLIARDAANGLRLWRHELPSWGGARGGKKVGPAQINRRLVARGERVYATLGESAPVSVLDAATGKILRTLKQTEPTVECILTEGVVVALVNPNSPADIRRGRGSKELRIVTADPQTGKTLWVHAAKRVLPLTMAADGKQVVYHDGQVIRSLDLKTGALRWSSPPTGQKIVYRDKANPDSPGAEKNTIVLAPQFAPTMVLYQDVVAFAGGRVLNVLSAEDGRELWRADYAPSNYSVPVDLFGFGGRLWGPDAKMNLWRPLDDNIDFNAYDPRTGKIEKHVSGKYGFRFQHHRCYQMKVVGRTVLASRAGIEFLDTDTGKVVHHHWTRGSCYYGVLPANGRLYTPPHDCACYIRAKLSGFLAMNADPPARPQPIAADQRLQRGPAYGKTAGQSLVPRPDDWPTHRRDAARSGRTDAKVSAELLLGWSTKIGGLLTSPVIAAGRVYLASTDAHTLHALDAATGKEAWQVTFDARIDSPPTVHEGLVLCGCRDGSVHALRAEDGALAWRFVASPARRMIVSRGQIESVWPVHGSVLVAHGLVYFVAGRSSFLDGGIRLYGLDPHTGRTVVDKVLATRKADGSEVLDDQGVDGFLSDVLSTNGTRLFLRHQVLDMAGKKLPERITHLHSPDGFLSSDTTTRLLWTYAPMYTSPHQGAFYDRRLSRMLFPSGQILVEGEDVIYGYGQNHYTHPRADIGGQWALFAAEKKSNVPLDLSARQYRTLALKGKTSVHFGWWKPIPIQVRAMVKTKDVLFVAGPRGGALTSQSALAGKTEAGLLAISPADGKVLAEMALPATPVWDGMAAAGDSLYVSLANGQVLRLWAEGSPRGGKPLSVAAWRRALPPVKPLKEPGLVGRWRFEEGEGMFARDYSGQANDARVSGKWHKGPRGTCLLATGTPQAAVIPDAPHLHFGNGDFTLALWVQIDGYDVRLLGKEAFPQNWWVINVRPTGHAELVLGEGRGGERSARAVTGDPLAKGEWIHLVAVVDRKAGQIRWYVNGKPDGHLAIPKGMTKGLDVAGVGISIPSRFKPFRGKIGDFRIYRRALEAERVGQLFEELAARKRGKEAQGR